CKFFTGKKTVYTYDLSKVVCYPNPARKGKITITNLPSVSEKLNVYIYTISGQMIISFSSDDTQIFGNGTRFLQWNCKTKSGNDVAQGIYIILIKNSGDKVIKKVAVIR
ncbi:T9SS type A sorting domain-containing protein, partial [Candidatus Ruminimicrobium bovinum]|uniref:T9SS type A sorting domain-containing protein n=1 Tax=Candidatus Ruminimicrobium bovinum TaxID=3242779 RepID=UPI0039B94C31